MCKINGKKLEELRVQAGISKAELARELGVSGQTITNYENGKYAPCIFNHDMKKYCGEVITIKETIDVPIIKKLVHLHNKEANVKTFIAALANNYSDKINEAIEENIKKKAKRVLAKEPNEVQNMKSDLEKMKELASATKKQSRALFSDDTTQKVLNHKSKYKVEE